MQFLSARLPGSFFYHGATYALEPLTPPEINPDHILVTSGGLERAILDEHPGLMSSLSFAAERLPGFPREFAGRPENLEPGSRILLLRAGGIGDLIMLTPALKAFRQQLPPNCELTLATYADCAGLFTGLTERLLPYPISLRQLLGFDYCIEFNDPKNLFETGEMVDYYLDCLGIDPASLTASAKRPSLPAELAGGARVRAAIAKLPGRRKALYIAQASDKIRSLPEGILIELARAHPEISFVVPGSTAPAMPNVFSIDTSGGLSDFVTAVAACDLLVSTDSAAYHIAAAFNVPALVFFGPISSNIRTTYYPEVVALDARYRGQTCSSPCGISTIRKRTPLKQLLGRNRINLLEQGTLIETLDGRSFAYDPDQGCPEMQACGSPVSPCLASWPRQLIEDAFRQTLRRLP